MSRKRKRLRKLLMGRFFPRDMAEAQIELCIEWGLSYADIIRELDIFTF